MDAFRCKEFPHVFFLPTKNPGFFQESFDYMVPAEWGLVELVGLKARFFVILEVIFWEGFWKWEGINTNCFQQKNLLDGYLIFWCSLVPGRWSGEGPEGLIRIFFGQNFQLVEGANELLAQPEGWTLHKHASTWFRSVRVLVQFWIPSCKTNLRLLSRWRCWTSFLLLLLMVKTPSLSP